MENNTSQDVNQTENNIDSRQDNSGSVNQTAVYSVGQASTYRLGYNSVNCPKPALLMTGSGSGADNSSGFSGSYAFSGAIVIPLGGDTGKRCDRAAEAITLKHEIAIENETAKICFEMIQAGVILNPAKFPILADRCQGIGIRKKDG